VAAGAGYLVYASAAGALQARGVPMLDSKRRVEEHLATLPVPHAVLAPAYFMDNLDYPWNRAVLRAAQWPIPLPPDRTVQLIPAIDMARFAAVVIEQPGDFAGHRVELASDEVTGPQAAHILSEILGRLVTHPQTMPAPLAPMARSSGGSPEPASTPTSGSSGPGTRRSAGTPCGSGRPDTTGLT
jgi:uncharacterized protein YbjT (DUF2867 family)